MHERAAVADAVEAVNARAHGARVAAVSLETGPGVEPEHVAQYWRELSVGTPAAGATLSFGQALDELTCLGCANSYRGVELDPCPRCGADGLVVVPAPEVAVRSVDLA